MIELLNDIYTIYDNIAERYDVYKVETIGDAYVVASGLPKRNGERHSNEIATMALEVMKMIEGFKIPWQPSERLLVRIGIHTGRKHRKANSDRSYVVNNLRRERPDQ